MEARHPACSRAKIPDVPIRSGYQPPDDAAAVFRRQAELLEGLEENKPLLREFAVREMRDNNATSGDLARLTGLSREYFRRIAREEGLEPLRPPTNPPGTGT